MWTAYSRGDFEQPDLSKCNGGRRYRMIVLIKLFLSEYRRRTVFSVSSVRIIHSRFNRFRRCGPSRRVLSVALRAG